MRSAARKALSLLETCAKNTGVLSLNVLSIACCQGRHVFLAAGVDLCCLECVRASLLAFPAGCFNRYGWYAEHHVEAGTLLHSLGTGRSFSAAACSQHRPLRGHAKALGALTYAYTSQLPQHSAPSQNSDL